ncbi:acireductone dioxygenase, partial [Sodalis-like symbiont of Bactericera trigonica]
MSALTIYSDTDATAPRWHSHEGDAIQRELNAIGVRFERWQADRELWVNPDADTVIAAYQDMIDRLVAEKGYQSWYIISM